MTRTSKLVLIGAAGALAALVVCCGALAVAAALGVGRATPTAAVAAAPTATRTPSRAVTSPTAATPTPAPLVVGGCGGSSVVIGYDAQLRADLNQWNRIVDAANAITEAWNTFLAATNDASFAQAAGNATLVGATDAYLTVAREKLPALQAETGAGRFAPLAARRVTLTEAQITYATLFRQAVDQSDREAWNRAADSGTAVDGARDAFNGEVERQCEFWRSRR